MIREGDISPLRWGMNAADLAPILTDNPLDDWATGRIGRQTLLNVDGVEFYFVERRQGLWMLLVAAWRIAPAAASSCFDFGWINQELTYAETQRQLVQRGWPYEVMRDPLNQHHPLLVIGRHAWVYFDDEGELRKRPIQKICLHNPVDAPSHYARLKPGQQE
ncbi:hypothetical protein DLM85_05305 [Hymenobacter edaphi]|uniref:Uncharacterized protein n=2 Tax=Hymenobacter edaphi TaxID=2211146 RepID=A0A328BWM8_9BACT|nr:hypothetical protein DLM85_05305 [Hymenobacter edaphi]